jgi:hypothetical protein
MIIVLFKNNNRERLSALMPGDVVVHANPISQATGIDGLHEYYLEGYGTNSEGLQKTTVLEVAVFIKSHKRIEIL